MSEWISVKEKLPEDTQREFCMYRSRCVKCPFANVSDSGMLYMCRLNGPPDEWVIGDWKVDGE